MAPLSNIDRRSVQARAQASSSTAVTVNLAVSNGTAAQRAKLQSAAKALEAALNNPGFEKALKQRFGNTRGAAIFDKLQGGGEVLSPSKDGEADLNVSFFDPKKKPQWGRKIAKSTSGTSLVQLNQAYFADKSAPQVSQTLAYMLAHKLGYGGDIPQAFASITAKYAREPGPAPVPTTPEAPTPAPTTPTTPTVPTPAPATTSPTALIGAFKQGGTGNCVSIAAIKAGMARFGEDGLFNEVKRTAGGYAVEMRDGVRVSFTDAELKTASSYSEMVSLGSPSITLKANIAYTAMAKRAQKEGNDGLKNMSLSSACKTLNNGENYYEGAHWLGLDKHVKKIAPSEVDKYSAVVVASAGHAMYATSGTLDNYGSKKSSLSSYGTRVDIRGRKLLGAYAII